MDYTSVFARTSASSAALPAPLPWNEAMARFLAQPPAAAPTAAVLPITPVDALADPFAGGHHDAAAAAQQQQQQQRLQTHTLAVDGLGDLWDDAQPELDPEAGSEMEQQQSSFPGSGASSLVGSPYPAASFGSLTGGFPHAHVPAPTPGPGVEAAAGLPQNAWKLELQRHLRRKLSNRISAKGCRRRHAQQHRSMLRETAQLQAGNAKLRQEKDALAAEQHALEQRIARLKALVLSNIGIDPAMLFPALAAGGAENAQSLAAAPAAARVRLPRRQDSGGSTSSIEAPVLPPASSSPAARSAGAAIPIPMPPAGLASQHGQPAQAH